MYVFLDDPPAVEWSYAYCSASYYCHTRPKQILSF